MLPINCGSHADYQNFVVFNLRKYYPDSNALARSIWDIIERFWNLDLSYTDKLMTHKYSKFGPAPFIMDMIYICLWIHKATYLCFLTFPVPLNMIHTAFYMLSLE